MADDTNILIGQIRGELTSLIKSVDDSTRASTESRARLYHKMEEVQSASAKLEHHLSSVENRLKKVEPIAEDVQRWKERGIGALMLIGAMSGIIGAAGALLWQYLSRLFGGGG